MAFDLDHTTLLADLSLAADDIDARRMWLGGSEIGILVENDKAKINALARIKRGLQAPEDLSSVLPVMLGAYTEPLNAAWFCRALQREITNRQRRVFLPPPHDFVRCTLDGMTTDDAGAPALWEAKHVNAFSRISEVEAKYQPQVQVGMYGAGVQRGALSIFKGTFDHHVSWVAFNQEYCNAVLDRCLWFWTAVMNGRDPEPMPALPEPPTAIGRLRSVSMEGNNAWAVAAADFLNNREAAKAFNAAKDTLKDMLEPDVGDAYGHGVVVVRNKKGRTVKPIDGEDGE